MKTLFVIIFAFVSLGFMVETPEGIRERERQDRAWKKAVLKAYDLKALRKFLGEQVAGNPIVDGIALKNSKLAAELVVGQQTLNCGDWSFQASDPKKAEFTFVWVYEDTPNSDHSGGIWKRISLSCRRESRSAFVLIAATRAEDDYILLTP